MSQIPRSTLHQARRPLCAHLLVGLEGIQLPLDPPTAINRPRSARTKCHDFFSTRSAPHGPTSHLPNEVGRRESARHNSSTRQGTLGAISYLHRASAERTCLEATMLADKEAPR